ncbi:SEL1-like repeat protein [Ectopseudomonas mendocina]|uniref:Sel1 repeat family protein n=1 Tax=Ectopseudomonas mendocina S5.2 TaxID=1225174 RepID=A0ABN4J3J2_ECTME|nr:hypothetical protein [Pseudomonas mendocina]ALN21771.1 hypothetical protein DW68_024140 [Pseudomonas mendocina S5.2]KER98170.1 hypothetical protein HN51_25585 [Pseudomonas mendocina]
MSSTAGEAGLKVGAREERLNYEWHEKELFLFKINPSRKKAFYGLAVGMFVFGWLIFSKEPIRWGKAYEARVEIEELTPQMAQLAALGKPHAVLWMIRNDEATRDAFLNGDHAKLKAMAEAGDAESMYLWGVQYLVQKKPQEAREWIAKAAAEGFLPAVKYLRRGK